MSNNNVPRRKCSNRFGRSVIHDMEGTLFVVIIHSYFIIQGVETSESLLKWWTQNGEMSRRISKKMGHTHIHFIHAYQSLSQLNTTSYHWIVGVIKTGVPWHNVIIRIILPPSRTPVKFSFPLPCLVWVRVCCCAAQWLTEAWPPATLASLFILILVLINQRPQRGGGAHCVSEVMTWI